MKNRTLEQKWDLLIRLWKIVLCLWVLILAGWGYVLWIKFHKKSTPMTQTDVTQSPQPSQSPAIAPSVPSQNPLVLSLPVSHGTMTETFSSWKDMQAAEQRLGLR